MIMDFKPEVLNNEVPGASGFCLGMVVHLPKIIHPRLEVDIIRGSLLGGSWDLVSTCSWAYDPTFYWDFHRRPVRETITEVITPVTGGS